MTTSQYISGRQIIGYSDSQEGSDHFKSYNPIKESSNPTQFYNATEGEVTEATQLAKKAFHSYRALSGSDRAKFINAICDEIESLGDVLIETYCSETGLPEGRAMGERGRTINQLKQFAELVSNDSWKNNAVTEAMPDRSPMPRSEIKKTLIPLGPVVVFGASNFPLAFSVAGGDTASALASGCPVIVKGHPLHAGTGELVARCIQKAAKSTSMPEGVFSYLISNEHNLGRWLVSNDNIKAVGFTGSIKGGRALMDIASHRTLPIPVFAEMGSINPVVITESALDHKFEQLRNQLVGSVCLGAGQFCTNPGLLIAIGSKAKSFAQSLNEGIQGSEKTMLHPTIKSRFNQSIQHFQQDVLNPSKVDGTTSSTVVGGVGYTTSTNFLNDTKYSEEVFGPYTLVVGCSTVEDAESVINACQGQLTGTLITGKNEDPEKLTSLIFELEDKVGRVIYNGVPTGVEVCKGMVHGGPYPASSDSRYTAVGVDSIYRWVRPVSYQDFPKDLLPDSLKEV